MQRNDIVLSLFEIVLELGDLFGQIVEPLVAVGVELRNTGGQISSRPVKPA